jgi:hypothetical protein
MQITSTQTGSTTTYIKIHHMNGHKSRGGCQEIDELVKLK